MCSCFIIMPSFHRNTFDPKTIKVKCVPSGNSETGAPLGVHTAARPTPLGPCSTFMCKVHAVCPPDETQNVGCCPVSRLRRTPGIWRYVSTPPEETRHTAPSQPVPAPAQPRKAVLSHAAAEKVENWKYYLLQTFV